MQWERREAARQEAAKAFNSDVEAEEAITEEPSGEVEEPPPSSPSVSENEAEIPKWFTDNISPENRIHGNIKLDVSDQVDRHHAQWWGQSLLSSVGEKALDFSKKLVRSVKSPNANVADTFYQMLQ